MRRSASSLSLTVDTKDDTLHQAAKDSSAREEGGKEVAEATEMVAEILEGSAAGWAVF